MSWAIRHREPARLSELVEGALSALLTDSNSRFIHSYRPELGDELGELFAVNYASFVLVLTRHALLGLAQSGRFKGERLTFAQLELAWEEGMQEALQRRSKTDEDYHSALVKHQMAISQYDEALATGSAHGVPASRYFIMTSWFVDKIVDLAAPERRTVMRIAASITDIVLDACNKASKRYTLIGP